MALAEALARSDHRTALPVAPAQRDVTPDAPRPVTKLAPPPPAFAASARLGDVELEVNADGGVRRLHLRGGVHRALQALVVALAEESGLIFQFGEWVVRAAVAQLAHRHAAGLVMVPVAVNVSARQRVDRRLVSMLRDALAAANIDAALLCPEIAESTAMSDSDTAVLLSDELSALGAQFSVDDFGTGRSSLARLKRFAIHELKIDRSFVQRMASNSDDAAIVLGTIGLTHGLGLRVIAEGVETVQQQRFLAERACDAVQRCLHGRPASAQQVESLLRAIGQPA